MSKKRPPISSYDPVCRVEFSCTATRTSIGGPRSVQTLTAANLATLKDLMAKLENRQLHQPDFESLRWGEILKREVLETVVAHRRVVRPRKKQGL